MTQTFTPGGGMNQDDSIITPSANAGGRNSFELGDYKYLLNARAGSSKSDNFGDVETIRGTTEITDYSVRSNIATNPDLSGFTGWSQESSGDTSWIDIAGSIVALGGTTFQTNIIYQSISPSQRTIGLRIKVIMDFLTTSFAGTIVFLNGTTVISSYTIISSSGDGTLNPREYDKYINITIPDNCDAIGFYAVGTSSLLSSITLDAFYFYDWVSGSRPSGTERVIGKLENKEFNLLYYFVYNSSGNHCIRFYNPITSKVYELLKWSGLSFESDYFVSCAMIDEYMAFTDRENSPRLININSTPDLFLILGASNFREYHISFHKWSPVMPPVIKGYYDTVVNNYKKFEDKTIQFAYRYIYNGRLKSRWSPVSNAVQNFPNISGNQVTYISINIPGFTLDDPSAVTQYNYFNNNNIKFYDSVEFIEIGYREGSRDLWRLITRYNVKSSFNTAFQFDGDSNNTPIADTDFYQLFDTVPFLAGCVEAIDNRFVFADCLDEKDVAPPVQVSDIGVAKFDASNPLSQWWNAGSNDPASNATFFLGISSPADADELGKRNMICDTTFKGRGIYKLGIQWLHASGWRSAVYTDESWKYEIPEETGVIDKFYALTFKFPVTFKPPEWAVAYQIMRTNCLNIANFMFGAVNSFSFLIDDTTAIPDNIEVPEELRNRIRQRAENAHLAAGLDYSKYKTLLDNKSYYTCVVSDVRKTAVAGSLSVASRLYIDVNNWYNSSKANSGGTSNNPMNKLFYNYKEGDRVRFLASTTSSPITSQKVVYDVPILEFTGRGIIVEKPPGITWLPGLTTTDAFGQDYLIEVYTPKIPEQSDYIYYESGEWYPVLYPGSNQRNFSKRDWTYTNNAAITCSTYGDIKVYNKRPFSYGDCHGIGRTFYFNIQTIPLNVVSAFAYTASMNPNPDKTFDFWEKCDGRSAVAYSDLPIVEFKTTQVRFGGQKVELSFVNNINRFRDEDQKIYPSEYGRIRGVVNTSNAQVESVGAILLFIGENETFSVYVNRVTLEDLSGNTQVALSDKVLGSYNTLLGSHGTINPESICFYRGNVYWWDASDGSWIRYGRDGLTEISQYKMKTWFKDLSDLLINQYFTDEKPWVISEIDAFNDELITRIDHSSLPSTFRDYSTYKGMVFSEEENRWKYAHSYNSEMFGKIKNKVVSFVGGSVFTNETNSVYSTFFGTKYDVYIEPVFNQAPKSMKSHQAIGIISSHAWSVDRFLSEYRGAKTKQQSSILLSSMTEVEDGYFAYIPNDQNTPNVNDPIINGNKMRSKAIRALLKLDPSVTTLSLLHYVDLVDIDSPKNL